jgi:hypothetical protein
MERVSGSTIISCLFILSSFTSQGQISRSIDQSAAVHVDHIEEFIDRFNFYPDSPFARYVESHFPERKIDRDYVLTTLMNSNANIADNLVSEFVNDVNNDNNPTYLDVYDALWYANVPVEIQFEDGQKVSIDVTLEVQLNEDYSTEWVVAGMRSDYFEKSHPKSGEFYISSSSHATYFPELLTGLAQVDYFKDIVADRNLETYVSKYNNLIQDKRVVRVEILTEISYHFLQIPNWIVVVDFKPQDYSFNTGWLIRKLHKTESAKEKRIYLIDELSLEIK